MWENILGGSRIREKVVEHLESSQGVQNIIENPRKV